MQFSLQRSEADQSQGPCLLRKPRIDLGAGSDGFVTTHEPIHAFFAHILCPHRKSAALRPRSEHSPPYIQISSPLVALSFPSSCNHSSRKWKLSRPPSPLQKRVPNTNIRLGIFPARNIHTFHSLYIFLTFLNASSKFLVHSLLKAISSSRINSTNKQ